VFFKEQFPDIVLLDNILAVILANPFFQVGVITLRYSQTVNNFEDKD
jgi:hypothetical protein